MEQVKDILTDTQGKKSFVSINDGTECTQEEDYAALWSRVPPWGETKEKSP